MIDKLLLLQKELMNLKYEDRFIITAPRRSGKTTLLRNLIATYLDRGIKKQDILYFAPQRKHFKLLNLESITTRNQYKGANPELILVEEAAYCDSELLEEMDGVLHCPKVFIGTPKPVDYIWSNFYNDWKCTTYIKEMIDQNLGRVFSFHFKDFDKDFQEEVNKTKRNYTRTQWLCEWDGKWVEG